jgi:hemoglobin
MPDDQSATEARQATPFDRIGGEPSVRAVVERFYDLMEGDPRYAELRALHAADLAPMRHSLTGFLTGWLGGPRDWFAEHPGVCVMSAHARIAITDATAGQWTEAMSRALADCGVEERLAEQMNEVFGRMSAVMGRR